MYSNIYLAYDRAVPVIRHKDSLLDFFSYMRQRAKLSHINEMAASLSFTTILSIVPMVTVSFALLAVMPRFLKLRRAFQDWLSDNLIPGAIGDPILMYLNQFALKAKGLTIFGTLGLLIGVFFTLITAIHAVLRSAAHSWRRDHAHWYDSLLEEVVWRSTLMLTRWYPQC